MGRFRVVGADRESGDDIELVLEAIDEVAAIGLANGKGVLVTLCEPFRDRKPDVAKHTPGPGADRAVAGISSENGSNSSASTEKASMHRTGFPDRRHNVARAAVRNEPQSRPFPACLVPEKVVGPRGSAAAILLLAALCLLGWALGTKNPEADGPSARVILGVPLGLATLALATGVVYRRRPTFDAAKFWMVVIAGIAVAVFLMLIAYGSKNGWSSVRAAVFWTLLAAIGASATFWLLKLAESDFPPRDPNRKSIWTRKIDGSWVQPVSQVFVGLVVLCLVIWWLVSGINAANQRKGAPSAAPPPIRVIDVHTGTPDGSVTFVGWKIEGFTIGGTMIWNGRERITDLSYTAKKGGVVVNRGPVTVPGGGMRANEPTKVHLVLMQEITPDMDITIEVAH